MLSRYEYKTLRRDRDGARVLSGRGQGARAPRDEAIARDLSRYGQRGRYRHELREHDGATHGSPQGTDLARRRAAARRAPRNLRGSASAEAEAMTADLGSTWARSTKKCRTSACARAFTRGWPPTKRARRATGRERVLDALVAAAARVSGRARRGTRPGRRAGRPAAAVARRRRGRGACAPRSAPWASRCSITNRRPSACSASQWSRRTAQTPEVVQRAARARAIRLELERAARGRRRVARRNSTTRTSARGSCWHSSDRSRR